jgi:phage repressor protein C with HTH and peptisase S24 domain
MYPTLKNGSIWLCCKPKTIKVGDIVVAHIHQFNKLVIKRVAAFNSDEALFLRSDNRKIKTIDSGDFGYVSRDAVLGKCYLRIL